MHAGLDNDHPGPDRACFATTRWSVVLAARETDPAHSAAALERLCGTYWYPLYAFLRRQGCAPADAQDLTQDFFARLLSHDYIAVADPARGRFRTFLLVSLKNLLMTERARATAAKRGGNRPVLSWESLRPEERYRAEPAEHLTPDRIYEMRWATTVLETALRGLHEEYATAGKEILFEQLKSCAWGEPIGTTYAELAEGLGMSEGAVKVAVHRLRRRYRVRLRAEIAHTVDSPDEVDDELRHLVNVLSG
jgi:RNA polymerase sigma-70 factor (ECF subfamily)